MSESEILRLPDGSPVGTGLNMPTEDEQLVMSTLAEYPENMYLDDKQSSEHWSSMASSVTRPTASAGESECVISRDLANATQAPMLREWKTFAMIKACRM